MIQKNLSATLATNNDQYLFQPVPNLLLDDQGGQQVNVRTDDKCPTLRAETHGNVPAVVEQYLFENHSQDTRYKGPLDVCPMLPAQLGTGGNNTPFVMKREPRYIVRRLTPTECARLQGFPDTWGHPDCKGDFADEEVMFWNEVRNTHAAINGKPAKDYTKGQLLAWYNKLHTDSAEYKMWGNGIALPPALYVMEGIKDALEAANELDQR